MKSKLARATFRILAAPRAARFARALRDPAGAQQRILRQILAGVSGSEYGTRLGITPTQDYEEFAERTPVVDYEALRPWIDQQAASGRPMLTTDPPVIYEATSGSTGRRKLVPYPRAMLKTFSDWFLLWTQDLLTNGPGLRGGKILISVSPALREPERTASGAPISFPDDSGFLSPALRRLWAPSFATPASLARVTDPVAYRRALAALLIAEPELEVAFIWSPTYLLSLLDFACEHREEILADFARGSTGTSSVRLALPPLSRARCALLLSNPVPWHEVWPALRVISCWADAAATPFAATLAGVFPRSLVQPKGLLATEGPITLPLWDAPAPVPFVDGVFLEFEEKDGRIRRVHELEGGHRYAVVVSQPGGLLRYRLHDRVLVTDRHAGVPCLRFVGREDLVGDLAGEKLGECFVRVVLNELLGGNAEWSYLEPVTGRHEAPYYRCVSNAPLAGDDPGALEARLEAALCTSPQYDYARALGQLAPARVLWTATPRRRYEATCLERGATWGAIKFAALLPLASDACARSD